jgi:ribonuclease P/MRP protein subunit RPP1
MSYYESCIHALPEGSDSPSRLALVARRLGYAGIVICNHTGFEKVFRPDAAREVLGIKVVFGVEVVASNPRSLHSRVAFARNRSLFVSFEVEEALKFPGQLLELNSRRWAGPGVEIL